MLNQVQEGRDEILRRNHDVTLRDKVRNYENHKALFCVERYHLGWFGHVTRISQEELARRDLLATPTEKRPRCQPRTR